MHAIRHHRFGDPDVLEWEEIPDPLPGHSQVRIRVRAAGVHRIDTALRAGSVQGLLSPAELPTVPGREVAGTVDALGPDTPSDWLGRHVAAHLGTAGGGYAELALADVSALHVLADDTDPAAAVAMVGTGRTATAVLDAARLTPDDRVLVLGAGGGLGNLLLQAARDRAHQAVGAAAPAGTTALTALGVRAVDYTDAGWTATVEEALTGQGPTVVFDPVGGTVGREALELLRAGGRHVLIGTASGRPTDLDAAFLMSRRLTVIAALGPDLARDTARMRAWQVDALTRLATGGWNPLLTTFPLHDAAAAHRAIEERRTIGKVVLLSD